MATLNSTSSVPDPTRAQDALDSQSYERSTLINRRGFLKLGLGALGALAIAEFASVAVYYLKSRALEGRAGGMVIAGDVESFPLNSVTEFSEEGFYLIRTGEGGFMAIYRRCPHLGCTVDWDTHELRFYCPCHGSSFDKVGGLYNPPVPRPLDLFAISIDRGRIVVDTRQPIRREEFNPDQVVYA